MPHACLSLYETEDLLGFYRGLVPSIILEAPQSAIKFSVYTRWIFIGINLLVKIMKVVVI